MPSCGADSQLSKRQEQGADEDNVDGPQPMKNCKPAKTNPNSADQFRQSHQAEYEARGKRSRDDVEQARRHNDAYPVLKDQLDKRRSTTRLSVARARREIYADSICSACMKLKRRRMRKNILSSRCQGRRNRRYKTREQQCRTRREAYRCKRRSNVRGSSQRRGVTSPGDGRESSNGNKRSVGSLRNPSSGDPSVSSYHSYPSLDHEPMVS